MSKERIFVGIDAGSYQVKTAVVQINTVDGKIVPLLRGFGVAASHGMHRGRVEDAAELAESIAASVAAAEKSSGISIDHAELAIGEAGLFGIPSSGSAIVGRADTEITELDIAKTFEVAEQNLPAHLLRNKFIIQKTPLSAKVDGEAIFGKPIGFKGGKLEAKYLFTLGTEYHASMLAKAMEMNDLEISNIGATPFASAAACLSKSQRTAGCLLANIGAETTSIVVYEDNVPISVEILPIGGADITNDIALGLKISLEEAESIKIGALTQTNVSKKKLGDIIDARLTDIFEKIDTHLKKQGKSRILPAGIILTGGASKTHGIIEAARDDLKLPVKIASIAAGEKGKTLDPALSAAYGLCLMGAKNNSGSSFRLSTPGKMKNVLGWFKQFLP